ncbi:patatin-like phospholipase family protein [Paenibacillus sp. ACRRX]|uniref:patatin-like phospholipase family protein n=1 Tax=Paenibacillus sp. ACRRX TaxID=2918206 RepID=UPI001EF4EB6C|nr:patatin-like phospholipase family protein [Paenibacillus sp. ACRRX]MCG7406284.1 patatin-like phospholipase family protein [Paenibacillus sp. ACRRX]
MSVEINAVFEGGGVRGISLAGAVRAAELAGISFRHVAGTSSGAIVASLIAAGYTAEEMREVIIRTPFSSFLKRAPIFEVKWIGPIIRLFLKKGLYSGEALEHWIHELLLAKGVRNFGDLAPGQLRIIASDITNGRLLVLPEDMKQYGIQPDEFPVSKAVRMSTSIPYFFDPVMIRETLINGKGRAKAFRKQFTYVVDGGMLSNFPLWLFDQERDPRTMRVIPTIGFQMVGMQDVKSNRITGLITMLQAMVETMISAHDQRYIEQHNRYRTIKIPTLGVGLTEFDITKEQNLALYDSGLTAGNKYFDDWTYTQYEQFYEVFMAKFK